MIRLRKTWTITVCYEIIVMSRKKMDTLCRIDHNTIAH